MKLKAIKTNGAGAFDADPTMAGYQPYTAVIPVDPRVASGGQAQICAQQVRPFTNHWEDSGTHRVQLTIL